MSSISNLNKQLEKAATVVEQSATVEEVNKALETETKQVSFKTNVSGFVLVDGKQHANASGEVVDKVGLVVQNAAERASDLIKDVGNAKTDLQAVTGSTKLSANGFLNVTVSAPFPAAIADSIKATTTATKAEINTIVQKSTTATADILDDIIGDVFGSANSATKNLLNTVSNIALGADNFLKKLSKGFSALIEDFIEDSFEGLSIAVSLLAIKNDIPIVVPLIVLKKVAALKSQDLIEEAAEELLPYTDQPKEEVIRKIAAVKTKANEVLEGDTPTTEKPIDILDVDSLKNEWLEENTSTESALFSLLGKSEYEIESLLKEFTNLKREVTEVIIESQEKFDQENPTSSDVHSYYVKKYQKGLPANFTIGVNGNVYRGRPLEIDPKDPTGAASRDHYTRTIRINVYTWDGNSYILNPSQSESLKHLLRTILHAYPGILVYDKNDVGEYDSGLGDFGKWMKLNFPYHRNVEYYPSLEDSPTKLELVERLNNV